jgi:ribonuclease M5
MIQEVIVVEGKSDIARLRQSVDADVIATEGFCLRKDVLKEIALAYKQRGIIILTDPDSAGVSVSALFWPSDSPMPAMLSCLRKKRWPIMISA